MRGPIQKRCERCGQEFECGQYGCWCNRIVLTERQYEWIAARFDDCLCPACLSLMSAGAIGPRAEAEKESQT
jgi:hypothetical protein